MSSFIITSCLGTITAVSIGTMNRIRVRSTTASLPSADPIRELNVPLPPYSSHLEAPSSNLQMDDLNIPTRLSSPDRLTRTRFCPLSSRSPRGSGNSSAEAPTPILRQKPNSCRRTRFYAAPLELVRWDDHEESLQALKGNRRYSRHSSRYKTYIYNYAFF